MIELCIDGCSALKIRNQRNCYFSCVLRNVVAAKRLPVVPCCAAAFTVWLVQPIAYRKFTLFCANFRHNFAITYEKQVFQTKNRCSKLTRKFENTYFKKSVGYVRSSRLFGQQNFGYGFTQFALADDGGMCIFGEHDVELAGLCREVNIGRGVVERKVVFGIEGFFAFAF